jgi:hypothetical protein
MRWSLDMGRSEKSRPPKPPAPKESEPITLPPEPPRVHERPEPQPELVDDSAVQITRR